MLLEITYSYGYFKTGDVFRVGLCVTVIESLVLLIIRAYFLRVECERSNALWPSVLSDWSLASPELPEPFWGASALLQVLKEHNVETHLLISNCYRAGNGHQVLWRAGLGRRGIQRVLHHRWNGDLPVQCQVAGGHCARTRRLARAPRRRRNSERAPQARSVVRETPLSDIHIENMLRLSRMGAVIFPPVPAFYNHPKTIDDLVNQTVLRILDQFDLHLSSEDRWSGKMTVSTKRSPNASKSRK